MSRTPPPLHMESRGGESSLEAWEGGAPRPSLSRTRAASVHTAAPPASGRWRGPSAGAQPWHLARNAFSWGRPGTSVACSSLRCLPPQRGRGSVVQELPAFCSCVMRERALLWGLLGRGPGVFLGWEQVCWWSRSPGFWPRLPSSRGTQDGGRGKAGASGLPWGLVATDWAVLGGGDSGGRGSLSCGQAFSFSFSKGLLRLLTACCWCAGRGYKK